MSDAPSTGILLKNGVVLIHDAQDHVIPVQTDILIGNGNIARIGAHLEAIDGVEIIDCIDKIISPGFIDTHHHGWQTQLKGRHADEQLLEYMVTGNLQSFQFSPEDVFYGQLAGMLEGIAAGTTTLVDHAHVTYSPDHAKRAIAATASSGIRSVFCYTPIMRVKEISPLTFHPNLLEDWVMQTFEELANQGPFGAGRVTLGFAFDLFFLPPEVVKGIFAQVKGKGVKTITTHGSVSLGNTVQNLKLLDLLDESIIVSHGGEIKSPDAELIKAAGAHISSTPSSELQMAMGRPYCFDASFIDGGVSGDSIGLQDNASLGIDCHTLTGGSILAEARIGLQNARNTFGEYYLKQGKIPRTVPDSLSVEAAFNLATVKGAEAVNMRKDIGRITEGYRADLVIFDALSPSMVAAAQHDPVAAIVLHSTPADIDTVIVDGIVRKRNGKLLSVTVDAEARQATSEATLDWTTVAKRVVSSRARMQREIEKMDFKRTSEALFKVFHIDESRIVDVR
ncbi:amidohydrolase [Stagonosporopsis vannaccii]|nr:amidohydrolase [Stagonosporopsis vannaccii]